MKVVDKTEYTPSDFYVW